MTLYGFTCFNQNSNTMNRQFHKILNIVAYSALALALYLNFFHKDEASAPPQTQQSISSSFPK